jgi:beta-N-acetylhexosaminidase
MTATPEQDLRRLAGQLVMRGFRGVAVSDADAVVADLRQRNLGSVVLFDVDGPGGGGERNVRDPEQMRALSDRLRDAARGDGSEPPPLIAIDQEGGLVARLKPAYGFPATRSAGDLGATGDPDVTEAAAGALAQTLVDAGVNMNLAPVVDVDVWGDNPIIGGKGRSFSSDPEEVAAHAAAYIRGHRDRGVLTCLKHFPGHGSSRDDSHVGFTDVTKTWSRDELIPFRRLLDADLVDSVMTAHVFNAAFDETYPATLSPAAIDGLLRDELGFDGVVVSDDMGMGAISKNFGFEEAVARCLNAGVDILALANQTTYEENITEAAVDLIVALVADGRLPEKRVVESAERVMRLRRCLAAREERRNG